MNAAWSKGASGRFLEGAYQQDLENQRGRILQDHDLPKDVHAVFNSVVDVLTTEQKGAAAAVPVDVVERAVRKLHESLGHARKEDMIRILQHGGASALAIKIARELKCQVCQQHSKPILDHPHVSLPREPPHVRQEEMVLEVAGERVRLCKLT